MSWHPDIITFRVSHCPINTLQLPKQLQPTLTLFLLPFFHVYISHLQNWMTCWLVLPVCLGHSVQYAFFKRLPLPPQAYELQMCQQCTPWKDLCGTQLLPDLWVQCKPLIIILQTWLFQLHFYRSCYPRIPVIISLLLSTVLKSHATFTFRPMFSLFSLWTLV